MDLMLNIKENMTFWNYTNKLNKTVVNISPFNLKDG